ncbi:MAG: 30S ribosomal protein S20 [Candidatus Yanofskybacteria bacterium CG10_big_fil_rev_8_21_14_0_10_46_23]|uniref:Small ribosomal subunit protein bS20 n=1 Tax=Candidatus Yanofskybacteria bacterium CG10_big_fil_rev_8_21_14_0_10_46_23 TaxID=1975098 RepID=A0A2H0R6F6_9BACT|nr:MAG: 30S ribosomal protein S20 [Candidatus Yanofskybacteria bacterium CG10_big_fil_rev_8_21_14_0_10_46_23]
MPITKGAKKALRQSDKRQLLNLRYKRRFRELVKEFRKAVRDSQISQAKQMIPVVYKALDKASKHGTIKGNTASRYKSRLMRLLAKQESPAK